MSLNSWITGSNDPPSSHWTIIKKFSDLVIANYLNSGEGRMDCSNLPSKKNRETYDAYPETDSARQASRNMREREAVSYLTRKGIHDIVDSLLGELLLRRPYDPYEYLVQLLDRRILTRDGLVDSPPSFSSRDIISQARQADPLKFATNKGETLADAYNKSYYKNMSYE